MDIADGPQKEDVTLEIKGINVFLEKEADKLLSEATLDYSAKRGVMITGMQAASCCG